MNKRLISIVGAFGLALGVTGIVAADTLDSTTLDGDGSSGRAVATLTDVCINSTVTLDFAMNIHRNGDSNSGKVFANGSTVIMGLEPKSTLPGGVVLGTGSVVLPGDWVSKPNGTTHSSDAPVSVSFTPTAAGTGQLKLNATANGVSTKGAALSLSHPLTSASGTDFNWSAIDCSGGPEQESVSLTVNAPRVVVNEGSTALNMGSWGGTGLTLTSNAGVVTKNDDGTWNWSKLLPDGPAESTVTVTASRNGAVAASVQFQVVALNVAPVINSSSLNVFPGEGVHKVGVPVSITGLFGDPAGTIDQHQCLMNWDNGAGSVTSAASGMACNLTNTYSSAGVYSVALQVVDKDGGMSQVVNGMVVVYDPSAGFVTGGGWVAVAKGSYVANAALEGKGNFGFVSKYLKGANKPTGQTEFQFKAGSFNFHSSDYQWLVVSGCKAQYKGTGTVNGQPGFGFSLVSTDGDSCASRTSDKFRIKVWNQASGAIVFDNRLGASDDLDAADPQVIGGGSIVIHSK